MDTTSAAIAAVAALMGGSGVGGVVAIFRAKADRDSTIATGSEAAVQSLLTALNRADTRVQTLETENERLREVIEELRAEVDTAQIAVRKLNSDLEDTRARLDEILGKGNNKQSHNK
jgi:septal ring factor EnvC (AmiA/AmiB activator)